MTDEQVCVSVAQQDMESPFSPGTKDVLRHPQSPPTPSGVLPDLSTVLVCQQS